MLLELKLRKIGNSLGMILPEEALSHLKLKEGDSIFVTESPDGSLQLSPSKAEVTRQMEVAQDLMNRYHNTLGELAK